MWGLVFPVLHRKAEIGNCLHQHEHIHMCRHTEKHIVLILTLLTLFGTARQCHINVLISCVFPKVLKNVIFPDRGRIRKIHTHDHQDSTEILNWSPEYSRAAHEKVLFKSTKTALLWKVKNLLFTHVGSISNKKVATSEIMQLLWGISIKDCWQ